MDNIRFSDWAVRGLPTDLYIHAYILGIGDGLN